MVFRQIIDVEGLVRKSLLAIVIIFVALLGGAVLLFFISGAHFFFDDVDRCLDAGGAWNYESEICEGVPAD